MEILRLGARIELNRPWRNHRTGPNDVYVKTARPDVRVEPEFDPEITQRWK
jgi:hypothetical protein